MTDSSGSSSSCAVMALRAAISTLLLAMAGVEAILDVTATQAGRTALFNDVRTTLLELERQLNNPANWQQPHLQVGTHHVWHMHPGIPGPLSAYGWACARAG